MVLRFGMDGVFVGDPGLSAGEQRRIRRFQEEGVLSIPAALDPAYAGLYGQVFTCRPDSPSWLVRFTESREYSCFGEAVEPRHCVSRGRGSITVDNRTYGRYSGEVQLLRREAPPDSRVNVIGQVPDSALLLADRIPRGGSFTLVEP